MTRADDDASLIVHSSDPYNAEPPLASLGAHFQTAQRDFYVRCHGNVPEIDAAAHRVRVMGLVETPLDLSVADFRARFAEHTVAAVMQCAGNRRADLHDVRPVTGDPWAAGAIGNAAWTGVRLADVLRAAGVRDAAAHVAFAALDDCDIEGERVRYGASIPMAKAMAPEVLLVHAMNGEALAPEHGHPLRVVVPGYAGVRSPKWLARIEVRDSPADNPVQRRDYKLLPPDIRDTAAIDWDRGLVINDMPINSAICEPADGTHLNAGRVTVRGYAIASGRPIERVDVSTDGGETWTRATLEHDDTTAWSWTLWAVDVDLAPGSRQLVVRAWDGAGRTQPSDAARVWNIKGYLSNAWHRITVTVG